VITHRNLELPGGVGGVGLAKRRRGEYTVVASKICVVEDIEDVHRSFDKVRMLAVRDPPAFGQTQVHVGVARRAPGIAPKAQGAIIKDGIVIVVLARGDVVGEARPDIDDSRHMKAEPQWIEENRIEAMPAVEIRAAPVAVRIVIIGRRIKKAVLDVINVVKSAGEDILKHDIQFVDVPLVGDGQAIAARGARGLELINVDKIGVGRADGPGERGIDVARAVEVQATHGRKFQREIILAAPEFALNRQTALHQIGEADIGISRSDARCSHGRRRVARQKGVRVGRAG